MGYCGAQEPVVFGGGAVAFNHCEQRSAFARRPLLFSRRGPQRPLVLRLMRFTQCSCVCLCVCVCVIVCACMSLVLRFVCLCVIMVYERLYEYACVETVFVFLYACLCVRL